MKRVVLAALLGGLAVFLWSAFSHMVLPLGEMGIQSLPNEEAIVPLLKSSLPGSGFYFFPGLDPHASKEERAAWVETYKTSPTGILVYRPIGGEPLEPKQLLIELLTNILAAWVAAVVIARTSGSYLSRVLLVGGLGLFGWFSLSLSYWNWYGFPTAFILAEGIDQVVGWLIGGLVIAKLAAPRTA